MKYKLLVLASGLMAVLMLAGCNESASSLGGLFGGDETIVTAGLPGGSGWDSDTGGSSGSGNPGGSIGGGVHQPEPATVALLGSGLFAYAFFRRKRK